MNKNIRKGYQCLTSKTGDEEKEKPEPKEDVDLLVDDIERHDAEGVVYLDAAAGAILVELAFGHLKYNKKRF